MSVEQAKLLLREALRLIEEAENGKNLLNGLGKTVTDEWMEGFHEDFWNLYPRKVGKPSAERAWKKLMPKRLEDQAAELNRICSGVEHWITYWAAENREPNKIPHPATFLNDRRFEDVG